MKWSNILRSTHKDASDSEKPYKILNTYNMQSMFPSPSEYFIRHYEKSQALDNNELKNKINDMAVNHNNKIVPYLLELGYRKQPTPSIAKNIVAIPNNKYLQELKKINKPVEKSNTHGTLGMIGAIAGLGAISIPVTKMIDSASDPNTKDFIDHVLKSKNLNTTYKISPKLGNSWFDNEANKVTTVPDIPIASHELGHAQNARSIQRLFGKKLGRALSTAAYVSLADLTRGLINIPVISQIPIASIPIAALAMSSTLNNKIKGDKEDSNRYAVGQFIREHPSELIAASVAPKLLEEATASIRGVSDMSKYYNSKSKAITAGLKMLLPAFSTYALASSIPVFESISRRKTYKAQDKEKQLINKTIWKN